MRPDTRVLQQLPVTTNWRTIDSVAAYREIMIEHEQGYFMQSSMMWEEILTDDRIAAVVDTRIDGLLAADIEFVPVDERRKSKQLAEELGGSDRTEDDGLWLRMLDPDNAKQLLRWYLGLGFCYGLIVYDTKDGKWVPRVVPWHPRFVRWDWSTWQFAVTAWNEPIVHLPRTDENPRSDGKWFVWGGYRSWMNGMVRTLGVPYLDRTWNQRDAARRSEKYGMGIVKGMVPPGPPTEDKARFGADLRNLGAEPTIVCPQGENGTPGFDVEVVEVAGEGWQIFGNREESLNKNVAVLVLGQNLTTEATSGSGTLAGSVHERVRGDKKRADARFFAKCREQVLCWWALYNMGDADLAPYPKAVVESTPDPLVEAQVLLAIVSAIEKAPPELDTQAILEAHGLPVREGEELAAAIERFRALQPQQAGSTGSGSVLITPSASAAVTKVNEVRAQQGLEPLAVDGDLTVAEYMAKHSSIISRATNAESGQAESQGGTVDLRAVARLSEAVALRAGQGKTRKQAKYQVVQAQRAARVASKAMRPFVEKVLRALEGAESFDDCRRAIIAEAQRNGADMDQLAELVKNVNLLARLHGREAALTPLLTHRHG